MLRLGVYVLYSCWACKVFLARLLFSQRSVVLAVKLVQILSSLREVVIFSFDETDKN